MPKKITIAYMWITMQFTQQLCALHVYFNFCLSSSTKQNSIKLIHAFCLDAIAEHPNILLKH